MEKNTLDKRKCLICNKKEKPLFSFPKDPNRISLWLENLGRENLLHTFSNEYLNKNARLCALHFKDEVFSSTLKLKLMKFAVPHPVKEKHQILKKDLNCNSASSVLLSKLDCETIKKTNISKSEIFGKSPANIAASFKTTERTQKQDKYMSNLNSPGAVENPLVTIITLCCTDTKEGIAFHKFLLDPEQRNSWISAVKHKNCKPSHINVLCPKHFNTDQMHCHSAFKMNLKENAVPNMVSSNSFSHPKDTGFLQKWKEVDPLSDQNMTINDGISKLHCHPNENLNIFVKVKWGDPPVSKISKAPHSLQTESISHDLPKCLPQASKRQPVNHIVTKKRIKRDMVQHAPALKSDSVVYLADNSGVKVMDHVNSDCDAETEGTELSDSFVEIKLEPIDFTGNMQEDRISSNSSHCDTTELKKKSVKKKANSSHCDTEFKKKSVKKKDKSYRNPRFFAVPSEWWGITRTPQYTVFSKWNRFYNTVCKVVVEKNNVKIFIKDREYINDNRKMSVKNIPDLLQEVDSYKLCAGIDDKTMTNCLGLLENASQEQMTLWCKNCHKEKKRIYEDLMNCQ